MNILIVGAGFSGATIAQQLSEAGHQITVIDSRDHIAGNSYDYTNKHGIRVHKYGPHIFHTNNERVWNYLQQFDEWVPYKHKVKAMYERKYLTLPPNAETARIVGKENIVDIFYRPYTRKMWGMEIEELDPDIINRVKIRDDDNEFYFPEDQYQAMPRNGYTHLIRNMLKHENITVKLSTSFDKSMEDEYDHIFNSMPIDVYWDYQHGELPWRSIKFNDVSMKENHIFPVAVVNFTHNRPHTRVTEWKHFPFHGKSDYTTVTYEEPCDYKDNNFERYYPVKDLSGLNRELYQKYASIPHSKMTFIGRCGMYVYIDMHQAISSSLSVAQKFIQNSSK